MQKGVCRGENDFGDSYLEINITRQHIWYYKQGKLIAQGDIVSGNVSNGNGTPLGIYEITYSFLYKKREFFNASSLPILNLHF